MITKQEIQTQIEHLYSPVSAKFSELLEHSGETDLCNRRNFTGHLTASGTIVHLPSREVLLLHHKALDKWLSPGGHIEPTDASIVSAAFREVYEETGLISGQLIPLHVINGIQRCVEISSHPIPPNCKKNENAHYHHDFRFVFGYNGNKEIHIDRNESLNYKWVSLNDPYLVEIIRPGILEELLSKTTGCLE